jgi:diacylglycerol kinase family enzyme
VATFTVDLGIIELDGESVPFVSHVVARRSWWSGELLAVMNAELLGRWDVAPRGHPNDGRLDVVHAVGLSLADRWKAWRRLPTGTHVPHPGIRVERTAATVVHLARRMPVRVDGVAVGDHSDITVRLEPDALTICI